MKTIANRFKVAKTWVGYVVPRVKLLLTKTELEITPTDRDVFEALDGSATFIVNLVEHQCNCMDHVPWKERECPKLGLPLVELKRHGSPSERRRNMTEKRKFGHSSRSHRDDNVLEIRRGNDKPRKPKVGEKRTVGRLSNIDGNTSKKAKTTQASSSQPNIGTSSLS
ncbi:hypothetical protein Cgig2_023915 [Carnegiea gigantea]|uniref:Uncharacterized protein n=1 Tax=Carnegiea gigantea TaxID=171969 RepID=A0A9Q1JKX3_9CARY|nr:hypothetical protein Cgig2_023915 [Carnegiea gigantea]